MMLTCNEEDKNEREERERGADVRRERGATATDRQTNLEDESNRQREWWKKDERQAETQRCQMWDLPPHAIRHKASLVSLSVKVNLGEGLPTTKTALINLHEVQPQIRYSSAYTDGSMQHSPPLAWSYNYQSTGQSLPSPLTNTNSLSFSRRADAVKTW